MEKQANQRRFLQPQCHTFTLVFEFKILKQILFNAGFDFGIFETIFILGSKNNAY